MKTNLSSQITLNRVSTRYYRPENAFERSVLTRLEKIPTDIYETVDEGVDQIARDIAQVIRDKQKAGRFCVLALAGGNSPRNVYAALVRMHKEEGLSFRNVIVFNLYEYYPLAPDAINSNLNALKEMLLDHVDIDKQNIFSPDGSIAKDTIFEYCRLYEQRIESFGGLDIALLGIGRVGNIGFNEPGSRLNSTTRLILLDNASRNDAAKMFGNIDSTPVSSITMGVSTILAAKKVYLIAWGEEKAKMVKECVEGPITDTIPASYLQTHNNAHIVTDLSAASNLTRIQRPWLVTSCEWNDKLMLHRDALAAWVDYARRHGALIIYDAAYEAFIKDTDSEVPHSIFEIPGAEEVAVECRSFSKTAGFTGLRCAFTTIPAAVTIPGPDGSRVRLQDMWKRRQSTKYNGCPYIVQRAAEAVYSPEGQEQVRATIAAYMANAARIRSGIEGMGLSCYGGIHAPYIWVKTPDGMGSWEFFDLLLSRTSLVCTPGAGFGPSGEGYVRFTAFGSEEDTTEALERLQGLSL